MEELKNLILIIAAIIASIKGSLDIIDWMKRKDEDEE